MNRPATSKLVQDDGAPAASILLVEPRAKLRELMSAALRLQGHHVEETGNGPETLKILSRGRFDLVILDPSVSQVDGTEWTGALKRMAPEVEILVTVSQEAISKGLAMTRQGAYDSLVKPFPPDRLMLTVRRALERKSLVQKVRDLEETIRGGTPLDGIVGTSRALADVMKMVDQIARLDDTVVLSGERGTGKELIARALHARSSRREKPFAVVPCGAVPEALRVDVGLGQTEARPNGAGAIQRTLFEEAREGTVFLDDVAELTPLAQRTVLEFLQDGAARLRGAAGHPLDVRLIAATSRDLESSVAAGIFNEDLYYRLNVISIRVPPLRERAEDIPLLARHFLRRAVQDQGGEQLVVSPRAMTALMARRWDGNVRELKNTIERAAALDRDGVLGLDDLPFSAEGAADEVITRAKNGSLTLSELEREYILEILAECGGSRKKTAQKLGITTATLWRKLKRFEKSA